MDQELYENILRVAVRWGEGWVDEKNSCRKEPKRAEKREEVIKDRLSTAVCIGYVKSRRELLKGTNAPSLCSNSYVQSTQLVGRMYEHHKSH
jgi:hypothetical protein